MQATEFHVSPGSRFITICFLILALAAGAARAQDILESPDPVLLSESGTGRLLAADADVWNGALPAATTDSFSPGARVVVFLAGVDLMPGEGANAFRVFAAGAGRTTYRLAVESLQKVGKKGGIYALTFRLSDTNGYNGELPARGEISVRVSWRGNTTASLVLGLGRTDIRRLAGKQLSTSPMAVFAPQPEIQATGGDMRRFMEQAAFGPSDALEFRLRQIGLRRWIEEQFTVPYPTIPYPNFPLKPFDGTNSCGNYGSSPEVDLCHRNHYWNYQNQRWAALEAFYGQDQLRRRVSWALHKIWVVSHGNISQQRATQEYIEILDRNAFGNYRTLMRELTLNPAMGTYLDMVRSTRFDPNENYPRELLQLFSVGLYMLNQDGTFKLDGQGNRIPTYDQDKIVEFTRVFTGWSYCNNGNSPECPNTTLGIANYIDPMYIPYPDNNDRTQKALFDYAGAPNPVIAACANCTNDAARRAYAYDSLDKTLDNIFYHPNVGPFVGKLLIQHLVTSDPSPAYVSRVAAAFNNNGAGVRGDLKAVVRAILLDAEARGSRKTDPAYGKLREPFEHYTNFLRTFNVRASSNPNGGGTGSPPASCQGRSDGVIDWTTAQAGQVLYDPPSVFSYFPPDYVVPGTDILGPEFALADTGS